MPVTEDAWFTSPLPTDLFVPKVINVFLKGLNVLSSAALAVIVKYVLPEEIESIKNPTRLTLPVVGS